MSIDDKLNENNMGKVIPIDLTQRQRKDSDKNKLYLVVDNTTVIEIDSDNYKTKRQYREGAD